jgi:vancomycin resistance protein YoaR
MLRPEVSRRQSIETVEGNQNMTTDEVDLVEEILGPSPGASAGQQASSESIRWESTSAARPSVAVAPEPLPKLRDAGARQGSGRSRRWTAARLALTFALGLVATLVVISAVTLAALNSFSNRVVPGVRVGSVDVSGLSRDQVIARLQTDYAYLGQGEVTVTTPLGVAKITYQEAGRAADVEFMADAAMRVGHTGDPIDDAVYMLRSAIDGRTVPIVVSVDPMAVATRVRELLGTTQVLPQDARATAQNATYSYSPATPGRIIDEKAISSAIVEGLTQPDAPAASQAGGALVTIDPQVSDADAQAAVAEAERMAVDVTLAWGGGTETQSPSPSSSKTAIPAATYPIAADTVRSWIVFGTRADGSYGAFLDPAPIQAYLSELAPKVATTPVEPSVVFDKAGKPTGVKNGKDGEGIDVAATSQAIVAYLGSLASGGSPSSSLGIVPAPISPSITPESLAGTVVIGSWTTTFFPGISNGFGANIRVPANLLNGQIVAPGQRFSFLAAVSPVDRAHGYTLGGVIENGRSNHTGAIGGGICSASTTMFNAAARAGLEINERHPHFYYIDRYPVGLDATVYSNGNTTWDLKWTNDTPNPIVIRGYTTYGSKSTITFQLWSLPLDRKVTFSPAFKANVVKASDHTQYVTSLKPGQENRAEYPTPGFSTSRTRTVTDATGKVIHHDTWVSHYGKVDGLLQIGRAKTSHPTPSPGVPVPAPAALTPATLAPIPNQVPGPRRRRAA